MDTSRTTDVLLPENMAAEMRIETCPASSRWSAVIDGVLDERLVGARGAGRENGPRVIGYFPRKPERLSVA